MGNRREQYKRSLIAAEVIILLAIHTALYVILWNNIYHERFVTQYFRRGYWVIVAAYPFLLLVFGKMFGLFKIASARMSDLIFSNIITTLCSNAFIYVFLVLAGRAYLPVTPLVYLFVFENVYTVLWAYVVKKLNNLIFPRHNLLLIHGDYSFKEIYYVMNNKSERYSITETISAYEKIDNIIKRIDAHESILISDLPPQLRNDILKYCYGRNVRVYMLPKLSDIIIRSAEDVHISDAQIFLLKNYGLSFDQKVFKRLFDIVVSAVCIVLTGWLMGIIAIIIKAEDGGPVFFRQERLTRDGKVFRIIKFRSMKTNAEKNGAQLSTKEDDRVTGVGKWLRKFHLDEMPQFFNVLKGDMSMVGPRPERPEIMKEYIKNIPEFEFRMKVKGGITGFAQVYGKYNTTPYNKLRLDLFYIQNYSFWLDLKCFFSTIKIVFRKETSEGVEANQKTAIRPENGSKKH